MKAKYFMLALLFASFSLASFANTDTIKVSGNCGICKSNIEKAAKDAGATSANWDKTTKILVVEYDVDKTSNMSIQKKVAEAGYDTQDVKASNKAYKKLEKCCQYERPNSASKDSMKGMNGRMNMNGKAIYGKGHSYIQAKPTDYVEETNNMQCEVMNNCCTSCCTGS
jgi:mercuric ion binding protein